MDLNLWIRFDQPGEYRIAAISHRVYGGSPKIAPGSNEIAIRIVDADPQWQSGRLEQILQGLNVGGRLNAVRRPGPLPDVVRELCDLGTENAAMEIAHRIGAEESTPAFYLYEMALIRSPFRAASVREMERFLEDPDAPITGAFVRALSNLSVVPVDSGIEMTRRAGARRSEIQQVLKNALPRKRGLARDVSEAALR